METLLAEMDRLIAEIADIAWDYQRMAAETAEELAILNPHRHPRTTQPQLPRSTGQSIRPPQGTSG